MGLKIDAKDHDGDCVGEKVSPTRRCRSRNAY